MPSQLSLFAGSGVPDPSALSPIVTDTQRAVAARLPKSLYFGTSSYTFPGWANVLFSGAASQKRLVEEGLSAYAKHPLLRTVGIDRTYWSPMTTEAWRAYAEQTPADFVATSKAFSELTTAFFPDHPRYGDRAGQANATFLDPELALRDVVRPYLDGMGAKAGPLVLEMAPIPERLLPEEGVWLDRLGALLEELPRELPIAIELRTPRLFTPRYIELLARHRATHVISYWADMPRPGEQARRGAVTLEGDLVFRLLQPPGSSYDVLRQRYEPFDRLQVFDKKLREETVAITRAALERKRRAFVIVGNKVEGCAPLTVFALAEMLST
jgi:uncharacterized protein YecE (DUF72 family)